MTGKRKKPFKKSLTSRSHPIPPKKIEKDKTKYDRSKEKENLRKAIEDSKDGK